MAKITLINSDVEKLVIALRALDKPYKWKNPGRVSYNLARSLKWADAEWQEVIGNRNKLLSGLIPEGKSELPTELMSKFTLDMQVILDDTVELECRQVKLSELDLDVNAIPPNVLAGLIPIIEDDLGDEVPLPAVVK